MIPPAGLITAPVVPRLKSEAAKTAALARSFNVLERGPWVIPSIIPRNCSDLMPITLVRISKMISIAFVAGSPVERRQIERMLCERNLAESPRRSHSSH